MEIIIGNILSFLGYLFDFIFGLKYNKKSKILLCNCFTSSLSFIAYFLLKAYDGLISCAVTLLRLITIYFKDKYNKKCTALFVVFVGFYALAFFQFSGIQTIILFLSMMCSFVPKWLSKDMQKIRIGSLFATILSIAYNYMIQNYAAISIQAISAVLIIITIIRWHFASNKKKSKR